LLLARRTLLKVKLNDKYKGFLTFFNSIGVEKADGKIFDVSTTVKNEEDHRPFKAYLDLGLTASTTGNKVFGILKVTLNQIN
jgi:large subunit ribosomal protein L5e